MLEFELNNKTRRQKNFRGSWILTFQLSDNTYIDTYIHIHMYIGVINGFLQVSASCVHRTDSAWNLFWLFTLPWQFSTNSKRSRSSFYYRLDGSQAA
jgi:hypothetical protein